MRVPRLVLAAAVLACASAAPAFAQDKQPLPPFELDAKYFTVRIGQDQTTATDLAIPTSDLASRLNGLVFGGTVYPIRGKNKALGIGAEGLFGRGITSLASASGGSALLVSTYVTGIDGQISANFGHREGWSYVSLGAGPMRLNSFLGASPLAEPPGTLTLNFGGGARWFNYEHLAIGFDIRFYLTQGNASNLPLYAGRGKRRVLFVGLGFSIK
jgi:hypothetical protein